MTWVLEIRTLDDSQDPPHYVKVTAAQLRVGRGYHNDVILHDPYVSAQHLDLVFGDTDVRVIDLNSVNGTTVLRQGKPLPMTGPLRAGDSVQLGQTLLTLWQEQSPVPAAQVLETPSARQAFFARPVFIFLLFILSLSLSCGWFYVSVWNDQPGKFLSGVAAGLAGFALLWAGPWAMVGRLVRKRARFLAHIAVISIFYLVYIVLEMLQNTIEFVLNESLVSDVLIFALNVGALAVLLAAALHLATRLPRRPRWLAAVAFALGINAIVFVMSEASAHRFASEPAYATRLQPRVTFLLAVQDVPHFMQTAGRVFDREDLNARQLP